jgi:hypothetical protein
MSGNLKTAIIHGVEPSSTGMVNYTVSGFGTPVAALMIGSFCSSLDSLNRHSVLSYGFTDGLLSRCSYFTARDGDANTHSRGGSRDTLFCRVSSYGVDPQAVANFNSWITDGIQLNWSSVPSDTKMQFVIILIGGTGVSAKVGDFTPSSSVDGTVDVTGLGIDPEILFFTGSRNNFSPTFQGTENASISLGLATSSAGLVKNACVYCSESHFTSPSDTHNGFFNNRCHRLYNDATNLVDFSLELTSVGTGQFTVTTRDYNTNVYEVAYLALNLNGDAFDIQFQSLPDSIGNQDWPLGGGLSFSPENLFAIASWNTTANADADLDYNVMFGAANSTDDAAIVITGRDNQSGGNEAGWVSDDYCFVVTSADGSIYKRGSVGSWGADRVTINFSSVSGSRSTQAALLLIGESALSILPNGIVSAEAFGSLTISENINVAPNGIASAEAFGSLTIELGNMNVAPNGIASAEQIGSISLAYILKNIGAIPSAETFGLLMLSRGAVSILIEGIYSEESLGLPTIIANSAYIALNSILSSEDFGSLQLALSFSPYSIISAESFGQSILTTQGVVIFADSIESAENFGEPTVLPGSIIISMNSINSQFGMGELIVHAGNVEITVQSIESSESFGAVTIVPETTYIQARSINSSESFGAVSVSVGYVDLTPNSILSAEDFGTPYVTVAGVQISPYSIDSIEAFGESTVLRGLVNILLQSIHSTEDFGLLNITTGSVTISPESIAAQEAFGDATLSLQVRTYSISSEEGLGIISISTGNVSITPASIQSTELFGSAIIRNVLVLIMTGLETSEGFGIPFVVTIVRNSFEKMMENDLQDVFFNIEEFAENVLYICKDGTTFNLPVIFDNQSIMIDPDTGAEVLSSQPMMYAQSSDFKVRPDKGDKVLRKGVRYQIISHEPDGVGVTSFRLHHERTV